MSVFLIKITQLISYKKQRTPHPTTQDNIESTFINSF